MRTIKKLTDNKYLNIMEIQDLENHVKGFQYAERRGVDSVAFICYDHESEQFLLNKELKPPINKMVLGAFGGSCDKDKDLKDIVIDEVKEEAGFVVKRASVMSVGKVLVSTQMNQYCYLYLVFVNKDYQVEREPENAIEAMAETSWHNIAEVFTLEDWKPITIIAMAQAQKII
jgi:8-oxo-dGTP pyrophosphatase MutT (NUDIX family)